MSKPPLKPTWLEPLIVMPDRLAAALALAPAFIAASPAERAAVCSGWNFGVEWEYPSPWRLACSKGERGSPTQRITTTLVLTGLDTQADSREEVLVLAVVYNSCVLAGLDAGAVFHAVAAALPERAAKALRSFIARAPEDKSLEAFLLVVKSVAGEQEIRANW